MALLDLTKTWVGTGRRADVPVTKPRYPRPYVRIQFEDGHVVNIGPNDARQLAKVLKFNADLIDPPTPRKRRAT